MHVWDVGEKKLRRWVLDGGFGSSVIYGDGAGKYLAIGYVVLSRLRVRGQSADNHPLSQVEQRFRQCLRIR